MPHSSWVEKAEISPDGEYIATVSDDGTTKIYQIESNQEIANLTLDSTIQTISFSPNGIFLAIAGHNGVMKLWSIERNEYVFESIHDGVINALKFSKDGKLLAVGDQNGILQILDVDTGEYLAQLKHNSSVNDIDFSTLGGFIAVAYGDCTVQIYQTSNDKQIFNISKLILKKIFQNLLHSALIMHILRLFALMITLSIFLNLKETIGKAIILPHSIAWSTHI